MKTLYHGWINLFIDLIFKETLIINKIYKTYSKFSETVFWNKTGNQYISNWMYFTVWAYRGKQFFNVILNRLDCFSIKLKLFFFIIFKDVKILLIIF